MSSSSPSSLSLQRCGCERERPSLVSEAALLSLTEHRSHRRHCQLAISPMFARLSQRVHRRTSRRAFATATALLSASALGALAYQHTSDAHLHSHTVHAASPPAPSATPKPTPPHFNNVATTGGTAISSSSTTPSPPTLNAPNRQESLTALKDPKAVYDILIIGGGSAETSQTQHSPPSISSLTLTSFPSPCSAQLAVA